MIRSPPQVTTHKRIRSPGKTTFLKFMLTWLISARQVVLLCTGIDNYLFYCGQVYVKSALDGFRDLPERQNTRYFPIWTLIDVDYQKSNPPLGGSSGVWPIQASPPDPVRWDCWLKRNNAALLGMPVWSMRELVKGYAFISFSSRHSIEVCR